MSSPLGDCEKLDVDFTFAVRSKTGKYFIGRQIVDGLGARLGEIWYWRYRSRRVPVGFIAQQIDRLQNREARLRSKTDSVADRLLRRPKRRTLHLDPLSVTYTHIAPHDIVLSHDMGPLTHPELFYRFVERVYRHSYNRIAAVGPHMVFVSEASRDAFFAQFPHAAPRSVTVIYPPLRVNRDLHTVTMPASVPGRFILTVGAMGARKSQLTAIHGYARSGLYARGISYVLCGSNEMGSDHVRAAAASTPGVHLLDYVSDAKLAWLYQNCEAFVLTSLLEGFGMPIAEAMHTGAIPILSRSSVLEEVAGSGGLFVDPMDAQSIATAMTELAHMSQDEKARRRDLLERSLRRFTDEAFNDQWRDVIDRALRSRTA